MGKVRTFVDFPPDSQGEKSEEHLLLLLAGGGEKNNFKIYPELPTLLNKGLSSWETSYHSLTDLGEENTHFQPPLAFLSHLRTEWWGLELRSTVLMKISAGHRLTEKLICNHKTRKSPLPQYPTTSLIGPLHNNSKLELQSSDHF